MDNINELQKIALEFRNERLWEQFHTGKDLAMSLSVESAELLELFLWKSENDKIECDKLKDELSDVLYNLLLLSHKYEIDIGKSFREKIEKNKKKYPVEKSKGNSKKYTDL